MELIHANGEFVAKCTFQEKDIPKSAKFRWNQDKKQWWTDDALKANHLIGYASPEAKAIIEQSIKKHNEAIEASKATDADVDIPAPEGLEYLPYQKAGINFASNKNDVLIGDEMGLGKTIQAIGVANLDPGCNKILVICPASLRLNWRNEIKKWLVKPLTISVIESKNGWENNDVAIINYDILQKFSDQIRNEQWDLLIVDECHYIKNPKALRTKQILGSWNRDPQKTLDPIPAKRKLFLTGTPIVNRPIELWPIMKYTGVFRNWKYYVTRFCNGQQNRYGWDVSGASNLDELQEVLRSKLMVRRLKKDVLKDLPAKRRQIIEIPANGALKAVEKEQKTKKLFDDKIQALKISVELAKADGQTAYESAVAKLSEAQQAEFAEMAKLRHETALAKVPHVIEHVREAIDSSGKVVLFAHHKDVVSAIKSEFGNSCAVLVGDTPMQDRQAAVDRFQNDEACTLFIGSIHAAGVGITLTKSSHVIFAELDWVPGNISQAEDRCHRIGQQDTVLIQHIVLEGSIDATMAKMIVEKQKVIDSALDKHHEKDDSQITKMIELAKEQAATKEKSRAQIEAAAGKLSKEETDLIHTSLRELAFVCDGAQKEDGTGFNKIDAGIGHSLASYIALTAKQAILGKIIIKKYKRQIDPEIYARIFKEEK